MRARQPFATGTTHIDLTDESDERWQVPAKAAFRHHLRVLPLLLPLLALALFWGGRT